LAAELTAFMAGAPDAFDLIVSADTLVYFGALEGVTVAAVGALREGGRLVFTLECLETDDGGTGFRLNPHGRYSHTEAYVRRTLTDAGLHGIAFDHQTLRLEGGKPVTGMVVVARKGEG